jgi:AcrR family transcriptional regulator
MADTRVNAPRTARERARAELTREIKEEAKRQLAATGADGLSLRAVARALGMVSSALYRYYPSRDELLTALIIDAYNALGEAAEQAIALPAGAGAAGGAGAGAVGGAGAGAAGGAVGAAARARWAAACYAIRDWARANPHEYALIYGSPVPGYRAPQATVGPAARVPLAFVGLLVSAAASGELTSRAPGWEESLRVDGELAVQAASLATALQTPDVPPDALVRGVIAWTQLFGMISFELFGQFVGSFDPPDAFFAHAVAQFASFVGLHGPAAQLPPNNSN